jgi:hypothetical protein
MFKPEIFKDRVLQEIRRSKYIHYLNLKRAKLRTPPAPKEPTEKAKEDCAQKEGPSQKEDRTQKEDGAQKEDPTLSGQ